MSEHRPASPADLLAALLKAVEEGTIDGAEPDYEAAQQVVFYVGGNPVNVTPPVAKAIVDAALAGRLVIPVGEEPK